jgi:inorganic pyrophosphatase
MAILSALATEVLIPIAGIIGIAFAVVQWVLVSKVKLSPAAASSGGSKNGYADYLIEEEEGLNDHNVVVKCAEIQNAISEGEEQGLSDLVPPLGSLRSAHFVLEATFFSLAREDDAMARRV